MTEQIEIGIFNFMLAKGDAAITFKSGEGTNIEIEVRIPGYEVGEEMSNPAVFADILGHMIRDSDPGLMKAFQDYTQNVYNKKGEHDG